MRPGTPPSSTTTEHAGQAAPPLQLITPDYSKGQAMINREPLCPAIRAKPDVRPSQVLRRALYAGDLSCGVRRCSTCSFRSLAPASAPATKPNRPSSHPRCGTPPQTNQLGPRV